MQTAAQRKHIKTLDFYEKVDRSKWLENGEVKAVKILGKHSMKQLLCTVVIRTYHRPSMLKRAINSALNQAEFDDYEIIVVDNEGEDLNLKTDTQKVVESVLDDKIIYYRYNRELNGSRLNGAASLVRTKYFVFLNDDDVLHKYYLKTMFGILCGHEEIDALQCAKIPLYDECGDMMNDYLDKHVCLCRKIDFSETIFGNLNHTTGVVYKTEIYNDIGGVIEENLGCGDLILASRISYYYNQYYLDERLYGTFFSDNQLSATNWEGYYDSYYSKYYWFRAGIRKKFGSIFLWRDSLVRAKLLELALNDNGNPWGWSLDLNVIAQSVGISYYKGRYSLKRRIDKIYLSLWKKYISKIIKQNRNEGFHVMVGR